MNNASKFQQLKSADWRAQLVQNQRRTYFVIIAFLLIYTAVGFIVDLYLHGAFEQQRFDRIFNQLTSLQIIPYATITMLIVAIISLWVTYALYDKLMLLGTNAREITPDSEQSLQEQQLYNVVEEMRIAAGLRYTPKVYIIEAEYMNAFASGYSEKSAMIAITSGLLNKLERDELQAVIAHELSHIRHGDIKLTLTATILSNIMLIVIDMLFYNVIFGGRSDRNEGNKLFVFIILLRYLLPLITILLLLFLSRTREYMADAGAVELTRDNHPLARALIKISDDHQNNAEIYKKSYGRTKHEAIRQAAYIFDPFSAGLHPAKSLATLFSTHPSLDDRLKAIGIKRNEQ